MSSVNAHGLSIIRDTLNFYYGDKCFRMRLGIFIKVGIYLFHKNYSMF